MDREAIIQQTAEYAQRTLHGDGSGHDWWHVYRVWKSALHIAECEGADLFIVQLGALLHDIADWKFHGGDVGAGAGVARAWLESLGVAEPDCARVCDVVAHVSFKGAGVPNTMTSLEGLCVQDADRLDAIGAVGIGRCFAYGGYRGRPMYDPAVEPRYHETFEAYRDANSHTIAHFYEKLLLLKDRMNTETARRIAAGRHTFMEAFLAQFYAEWEGQK